MEVSEDDRRPAVPDAVQVAEMLAQVRAVVREQEAVAAAVPVDARRLFARLEAVHAVRTLAEPVPHSCTSSNQSGPLRSCRKRHFPPLCRVVRHPQILSSSCL